MEKERLRFSSDYMEGAHPKILERLVETNFEKTTAYGGDIYSESARDKIRKACKAENADVYFLVGGTQVNATMIDAFLASYQGVIAADTGHIALHEAGAIEFGGHKVMTLPEHEGKLTAEDVKAFLDTFNSDDNRDHMTMPGLVYISHPSEQGTLYSLNELKALSEVCRANDIPLYLDGARLAYALACPENDVTLEDLAKYCDAFYIGGTKCGALFGEAVVVPEHDRIPHLFTIIKQHGALLAKGRIAGLQFDTLFTDGLYEEVGRNAIDHAETIRKALKEKGYSFAFHSPTNQLFVILDKKQAAALSEHIEMAFWENRGETQVVMRIATSWATKAEDVEKLISCL